MAVPEQVENIPATNLGANGFEVLVNIGEEQGLFGVPIPIVLCGFDVPLPPLDFAGFLAIQNSPDSPGCRKLVACERGSECGVRRDALNLKRGVSMTASITKKNTKNPATFNSGE